MSAHACGQSHLDPGNCPACNSGDRPMSGSALSAAYETLARIEDGLCVDCGRPVDSETESVSCPLCNGELSSVLDDLDAFEEGEA